MSQIIRSCEPPFKFDDHSGELVKCIFSSFPDSENSPQYQENSLTSPWSRDCTFFFNSTPPRDQLRPRPGARFQKVPKLFGWHNSHFSKRKLFRVTKLSSYFHFYSLFNIWKDQLSRIRGSESYEWLFGPVKFSSLLRNARLHSRLFENFEYEKCSSILPKVGYCLLVLVQLK